MLDHRCHQGGAGGILLYMIILCTEKCSIRFRNNKNIKGITAYNIELKFDEASVLLDESKTSLEETIQEHEIIAHI